MRERSNLQPSTKSGMLNRWKATSIVVKTRGLMILCFVLLIAICLAAIGSMRVQSTQIDNLMVTINPAMDTNQEIFRGMGNAESEILQYLDSRDPERLNSYRAELVQIEAGLVQFSTFIKNLQDIFEKEDFQRLMDLEKIQSDAVERWLSYAQFIEDAVRRGEPTVSSTEVALFDGFVRVSNELDDDLSSKRQEIRTRVRSASERGTAVLILVAVAVLAVMFFVGMLLARSISAPLVALSNTFERQREGDRAARAVENQGSTEIRNLAHDFNRFVERDSELERIRSLALRLQELTVKIEHAIRIAPNTQQAMEILCVELGTGLGVDRVVTNTLDEDSRQLLNAQWHRPELSALPDLSAELAQHASGVAKQLWKSSSQLVTDDSLAPEAQNERSKAFYNYSGYRAVIITPIGVGDQLIGTIYLMTTIEPRHWTEAEVNAVGRVAAFLAQFIVEQTYHNQLSEHIERLEQLNRQKDTFVATVSHELRTPLTSIIGYLEVIKDGYAGDLTDEQVRMLEVMDRNADRLLGLIESLLALNKRESNAVKIELANVSMRELITSLCHEMSPLAESGDIKIDCDAGPERAIVRGDESKLRSAIENVVSNAIKFSRRGSAVTISCELDDTNRQVHFTCRDRGIGIPAADLGELFKRFFRGSNAMTKFIPGTGLGLTIVKQIVDELGGEIHLNSIEGEGTTVVIDLPLSQHID